jgi:hypothetical protein
MFSKTVVDSTGTEWKRNFYVYIRKGSFGIEQLEKYCTTMEEAQAEARKHVHRGTVLIKEQLERVAETFPETPVCT